MNIAFHYINLSLSRFFKTYNEAVTNLPYQEIIKQPLKLKTRLPDTVYASPLDGYFTTVPYAEAIRVGDALVGSGITRNFWWRTINLIPKGLSQAAKTILGPFTHMRNFFSSMFTTIDTAKLFLSGQASFGFSSPYPIKFLFILKPILRFMGKVICQLFFDTCRNFRR